MLGHQANEGEQKIWLTPKRLEIRLLHTAEVLEKWIEKRIDLDAARKFF